MSSVQNTKGARGITHVRDRSPEQNSDDDDDFFANIYAGKDKNDDEREKKGEENGENPNSVGRLDKKRLLDEDEVRPSGSHDSQLHWRH